ncbi:hypothetical protein BW730_02275 [Tessaracoccus aquimaris]|uniref:ABC transmembrane type-1 domain-containing protein n=1 Tax=Tessaracoccus aquimaris TaxID=1332264 RepID=A0A1Q2CKA7_9ACTN|nr:sugar ABC transporter permease [Tessaracoccus aquimaris]AQP46541.1 hypothetical protein BW730_02275 [Tessaracoccus aquimaris]
MSTNVIAPSGQGAAGTAAPQRKARALPYLLLAPAAAILLVVLGYPVYRLLGLSFSQAKLRDFVKGTEHWNNFANYTKMLADGAFWAAMGRTVVFTVACVVATMVIGTLLALMMVKLRKGMRLLLLVCLLLAWATPQVTATQVWQWLFDTRYGLINHLLSSAGFKQFENYSWLASPVSLLAVAGIIVVWGAVPFVTLTLYAGRTQVSESLYESAGLDGAGGWRSFFSITLPMLAPIFTMLAALSTIWDFRVFTQVFLLQQAGGITSETNLIAIYAYRTSFSGNDFGLGAAMAMAMIVVLAGLSVFYVRRMLKEVQA